MGGAEKDDSRWYQMCTSIVLGVSIPCKDDSRWYQMCTSILLGVSIPCKDDSRWYQNVYQYTAGRVHTM
ncbi:hypothetical protein RRG08_056556 [Elysia crispata]|uniref:Uncharacterized protein n=1 Tax=Elysia crispata TaxID=231223 RepID=A0AAE0YDY0_9GAST|nr:hypothetical protein RRG08_056556 [Elysia crispata]